MSINRVPTVLIVEDEPVGIASLVGILGDACELIISQSLLEAKELLSDEIDIVLLDVYLPDGSGLVFLDELRESERFAYVPVICISASDNTQDIEEAFRRGATDYVLKPFNKTILNSKVSTFIDLKRKTDMLAEAALIDPLTRVGNRRLFNQQFDLEWRRAWRQNNSIGLMLVDLDHFKQINDQHGHAQGDACLQTLAYTMKTSFARAGEVVARIGGDEFVAIIPGAGLQNTVLAANNLMQSIRAKSQNRPQACESLPTFHYIRRLLGNSAAIAVKCRRVGRSRRQESL